jgi:hypothetical protein
MSDYLENVDIFENFKVVSNPSSYPPPGDLPSVAFTLGFPVEKHESRATASIRAEFDRAVAGLTVSNLISDTHDSNS